MRSCSPSFSGFTDIHSRQRCFPSSLPIIRQAGHFFLDQMYHTEMSALWFLRRYAQVIVYVADYHLLPQESKKYSVSPSQLYGIVPALQVMVKLTEGTYHVHPSSLQGEL